MSVNDSVQHPVLSDSGCVGGDSPINQSGDYDGNLIESHYIKPQHRLWFNHTNCLL